MNRILVDHSVHQTRIALVEDGRLAEIYYSSRNRESLVGNIYVGRVETVATGLQAAFVDIGESKNAYLYYGSKRAVTDEIANRPKSGETVIVQVEKDAAGGKGAVVGTRLSIPGKFLVLLPNEPGEIGISKKITDTKERERIQELLGALIKAMLPKEFGVVVRTNGEGKSQEAYAKELETLVETYAAIEKGRLYGKAPAILRKEAVPILKAARDLISSNVIEFVVNDKEVYEELLESDFFEGEEAPKLLHYQDNLPLFDSFFLESQVDKALESRVWLKSGGFLVIEETEMCVCIDVNTGKFTGKKDFEKTILKTNMEAVEETARQLRLRNLSGIIIIDFIDMTNKEYQNQIQEALEKAVRQDRVKTMVVGMTKLGLWQLTRKKTRPSLQKQATLSCEACKGSGRLPSVDWTIGRIRRQVTTLLSNTVFNHITVKADKRLLFAFAGEKNCFVNELAAKYSKTIVCEAINDCPFGYFEIEKEKN